MYAPELGRFMQTDPVGYDDGMNLYSYVGNDPVNGKDSSGEACIAINGLSAYCRRAEIYRRFDNLLRDQTRFFAAASMTVTMLANLDIPLFGAAFSSSSMRTHLSAISSRLEGLSVRAARQIESGNLGGWGLDNRLIRMEQNAVQSYLDNLRSSDPESYRNFIAEVNSMLNPDGLSGAASNVYASDRSYGRILDSVRSNLGRDIDFSRQSDREAIGREAVRQVRRASQCAARAPSRIRCQ